jgi:hypothetical protein
MTNVRSAKLVSAVAPALALTFSLAPGQTAPTPVSTAASSPPAVVAPATTPPTAHATGQIGPGTTGTISPSQGVTPATAAKAAKILKGALTPGTRQTLQDAMNAVTPPP